MSEPVFFDWIEVEAFRGFQDAQRFELDASVVLVTGPNGTGKTSLFDALQWLLVGSIQRLEAWRVRRNAEHIVNQWRAESGDLAIVSAGVRVGERRVELRRSGRHDGSHLEWRDQTGVLRDEDAEAALASALVPAGRTSLRRSLLRCGLLQQDVIRDVLEDKPAERYEQLAAILGLDAIAGFPEAARSRAARLTTEGNRARADLQTAETQLATQRARTNSLREAVAASPNISQVRTDIADRLAAVAATVRLRDELPVSPLDAQAARTDVARLGQALSTALEASDTAWAAALATPAATAEDLDGAQLAKTDADAAVSKALERLTAATERYERERAVAARFTRLAVEALPLLTDRCPVCEQEITPENVREHLQQLLDGDHGNLAGLEQEREAANAELVTAQQLAAAALAVFEGLQQKTDIARRATAARQAWLEQLSGALPGEQSVVQLLGSGLIAEGDLDAVSKAIEGLQTLWRALGELAAALGSAPESTQLITADTEIRLVEARVADSRERAVRASAAEEEGKALQRAAVRAATAVTNRRFDRLRPIIQDIYSRLDPHPAFTDLLFAVDVYRERSIASPQVSDPDSGVAADPLLVFSSAQANVVALSAFLALGWAAREDAMPFLLLDDPLQSLDDVNALGFADLCRHIRTRRQLIVSTHDKRLAALLERKLAPRREGDRTIRMRFNAWSRSGPNVETEGIPPQTDDRVRRALLSEAA
jgi:DNA repair exonuclease SbcCD ATPase subunit